MAKSIDLKKVKKQSEKYLQTIESNLTGSLSPLLDNIKSHPEYLDDCISKYEKKLKEINQKAIIVKSIHKVQNLYKLSDNKRIDSNELKNKSIILVSAIGNPNSFEKTVLKLGLKFKKHFIFRDHYRYKDKDLKKIKDYCDRNNIDRVLTTEKDAVKLRSSNFLALHIELEIIENEQAFYDRLFGIYNS